MFTDNDIVVDDNVEGICVKVVGVVGGYLLHASCMSTMAIRYL